MSYRVGKQLVMTEEALENYGEQYRDVPLTVSHVAYGYMPAEEFYRLGKPEGYHPGYDGVGNGPLYDFEELQFSLYSWEVKAA